MQPSYEVSPTHPAGCISWHDARFQAAGCAAAPESPIDCRPKRSGENAARATTATAFRFGDDETQLCTHARFADLNTPFAWRASCRSDATALRCARSARSRPTAGTVRHPRQCLGMGRGLLDANRRRNPDRWSGIHAHRRMRDRRLAWRQLGVGTDALAPAGAAAAEGGPARREHGLSRRARPHD